MTFQPLIFFPVVTLVAVAIHVYLWARLVRSTTQSRRHRRIGALVIAALGIVGVVGFMVTRTVGVDVRWLAWIGYGWIAVLFYLLLTLIVLEVPRAAYAIWTKTQAKRKLSEEAPAEPAESELASVASHGRTRTATMTRPRVSTDDTPAPSGPTPSGPANPDRRLFLARACALTAGGVAALAVGSGAYTAFRGLRTVHATAPVAGLDPSLSGFRIAVISDTHFGPFLRDDVAQRLVEMVNREQVDLVTVLGDLADGTVDEVGSVTEPLRRLQSRHGTFFVTGNHEYSSDVDPWIDKVRELGMRPLLNERVEIASGRAAFDLAGVNDLIARFYDKQGPDIATTVSDRDPSRPVVLLAHQPVQVHEAMKHGVGLQLSGHTHGGQTRPFDRLVGVQQPVTAGLARMGETSLFVTRGVGFFGPPVRLGIPPEVAIVQLQAR